MRRHDLVIIGTGSGNTFLDERYDGVDVAIVEEDTFGGTCLNTGCVPTKMFVYAADVAETIRHAARYGIDAGVEKVRWPDIRDRVFGRIDAITAAGERYRVGSPNVTVYKAHARFVGPRRLRLDGGAEIIADRVVIAAGSRPLVPPEVARGDVPFHTSDTIMRIDALPERIVLLGGGYVASEFAHVFSALGSEVAVVARGPRLLRHLDETVSERFTAAAREQWEVHTGAAPERIEGDRSEVRLHLPDGSTVVGDALLVAVGRVPNSDRLDVAAAGVATHPSGRIVVDAQQRTSVEGIYALGDISSPYMLKHVANREAAVVGHNLIHPDDPIATDHSLVPSAVFTEPQIAAVGLTEQAARLAGLDHATAVQEYAGVAYGWAMEDTTGFAKVIAEPGTGRLLGAHLMGPQASTLIQPLVQAMAFGLGAAEMAHGQYWIHPALPEVIENALLTLDG